MTIGWGDTGKPILGVQRTFTINPGSFAENNLGSAVTLPNAEGATDQISFTLTQAHFPTITPAPVGVTYTACIVAAGQAVTAATPSYRVLKNGSSIATAAGSAVAANTYYTHNHFRWSGVQVGDVLDVRMWSNQSDTTLLYYALVIYPTAVFLTKQSAVMYNLTFSGTNAFPTLTGRTATSIGGTGNTNMYPSTSSTSQWSFNTGPWTFPAFVQNSTYGLYSVQYGGNNTAITQAYSSATSIPQQQKNWIPQTISFREILRY